MLSQKTSYKQNKKRKINKPFFASSTILPKLSINQPNDKYEQQADSMANKVMSMSGKTVQRKCANCAEEEEALQTKSNGTGGIQASAELLKQLNSSKGGGSALPKETNQFMSSAFGSNFSNVRIHTGHKANAMNENIQAKAFTHGSDIYFRNGQYNPGSANGKHLLAHELTHVVQQGNGLRRSMIQRDCCSDSKAAGQDNGDVAGVICCNKTKHACVWISGGATGATNAKAVSIVDACSAAHERDHFDDIDCPDGAGPFRPNFKAGKVPADEEKKAYKAEQACLESKIANCGRDATCKTQVNKELTHVKANT